MTGEINQYVPGFIANLRLSPQQASARLIPGVMADFNHTAPGTLFNADDIDEDNDGEVAVVGRAPPTPESFAAHLRRVGFFEAKAKQKWIEDLEKVRMLEDPTNAIMQSMMNAKNRATDDRIITGLFENSRNGQNGETSTAWAGTTIGADDRSFIHDAESLPASGDLPLTVGKVIYAKKVLDTTELEGPRYFAVSAHQLANLLSSTPATSGDYNMVKALQSGQISEWHGFTWLRTERLPIASNNRTCAAWIKTALQYKERPIKTARLTERPDRSYRVQAYYEIERGFLRRYDEAVVKVLCAEDVF